MAEASKRKVIIVDDDKLIINMYSLKFKQEGIEVSAFMSGEELFEKLKDEGKVDLLMLDLVIPGFSGFDILERIRKAEMIPGAKVIILTNQNEQEDIKKAKDLGADLYIVKATTIPSEVVKQAVDLMNK